MGIRQLDMLLDGCYGGRQDHHCGGIFRQWIYGITFLGNLCKKTLLEECHLHWHLLLDRSWNDWHWLDHQSLLKRFIGIGLCLIHLILFYQCIGWIGLRVGDYWQPWNGNEILGRIILLVWFWHNRFVQRDVLFWEWGDNWNRCDGVGWTFHKWLVILWLRLLIDILVLVQCLLCYCSLLWILGCFLFRRGFYGN
jgi:hypothetical protein